MRLRPRLAPRIAALAAAIASLALLAGCGEGDEETPVACLEGAGTFLGALADAPGQVQLDGETPISECLVEAQPGGELATVGAAMVEAATRLNTRSRLDPRGPAAVRLGYLLGAATRGARDTDGIHADLIRRLNAAADYAPAGRPRLPVVRRAYRRGFAAGQRRG